MSCIGRNKPSIGEDKNATIKRISYFKNNKYDILNAVAIDMGAAKESEFVNCTDANTIKSLLAHFTSLSPSGMRIYFASFSDENTQNVPQGFGNTLTLILVPTQHSSTSLYEDIADEYYFFDPIVTHFIRLSKYVAEQWVSNYQNNKWLALGTTVSDPKEGDTKSILYDSIQLGELYKEVSCQLTSTGKIIKGLKIYFTSHTDEKTEKYPKKLNIDFTFTGLDGTDIYLEDTDDWNQRPDPKTKGLDTGNPCPPNNCPGSSLPQP